MARCADRPCRRWRPDLLVGRGWGATLDGQWYCSQPCVARLVQRRLAEVPSEAGLPAMPRVRLGALLKQRGVVPPALVDEALAAQRETGLKLGEQLQALGVELEPILEALAAQSGARCMPFVDPQSVSEAPGGFNPATVRAIGLVPLGRPDGDTLRVAAAAPVSRRALNALRLVTGLVPEPYVVSDDSFAALLAHYGADGVDTSRTGFYASTDPQATAGFVAELACRSRTAAIGDAWLDDDRRWVRVNGDGRLDDVILMRTADAVLMPTAATMPSTVRKEPACLAATT